MGLTVMPGKNLSGGGYFPIGPRFARKAEPLPVEDETFADPANGELVARCAVCGMPDRSGNRVLEYVLEWAGDALLLRICEHNLTRLPKLAPTRADPLQLPETA